MASQQLLEPARDKRASLLRYAVEKVKTAPSVRRTLTLSSFARDAAIKPQ
jgi:hypothetical protein